MSERLFAPYIGGPGVAFSDRKAIERMLQVRNIKYEASDPQVPGERGSCLTVEDGYAGFYTVFLFDDNDSLVSIKAFE